MNAPEPMQWAKDDEKKCEDCAFSLSATVFGPGHFGCINTRNPKRSLFSREHVRRTMCQGEWFTRAVKEPGSYDFELNPPEMYAWSK